jgi:hypothetical protein
VASKPKTDVKAGAAGVGAGTSLLGLANLIPDSYPVTKAILIYISPASVMAISYVWWVVGGVLQEKIRQNQIDRALKDARKIRDVVNANPASSDAHKKRVQDNVEKLEELALAVISDRTEDVRTTLKGV